MCPLFEPVQVPLDGILSFCCVSCSPQLSVISKFADDISKLAILHLIPLSMLLIKILKSTGPTVCLGYAIHDQPPPGHRVIDHNPVALTIQSPPNKMFHHRG